MNNKHYIYCGGIATPSTLDGDLLQLNVAGADPNVNLRIMDIHRAMVTTIPSVLIDLLEIASYVYCADQHIRRGGDVLADTGRRWRRDMHFTIPVRNPDLWNSQAVNEPLTDTLWFMTEDTYSFQFISHTQQQDTSQHYFEFNTDANDASFVPDEVALFSGGLDSFSGAVEGLIVDKKRMACVGHHSCPKIFATQKKLVSALKEKTASNQLFYVPVEVTNKNITPSEYTQRSRSFLFASLALTIAQLFGKDGFRFYENGVVSLNVPISNDVLGARATRTTHPRVLQGFQNIFSAILDKNITIENPYAWKTKADVIRIIAENNCASLIEDTRSCTRPREWSPQITHCGICSQCLDRRFGVLAAGMGDFDTEDRYRVGLLLGDRSKEKEILMAAHYVQFAREMSQTGFDAFQRIYPEITTSIGHFAGLSVDQALQQAYDLLQRHVKDVMDVVEKGLSDHARKSAAGILPPGSILALVSNRNGKIEVGQAPDTAQAMKNFVDRLSSPHCEFVADEENNRILFAGDFYLENTEYLFIKELLPNFRSGKRTTTGEIRCVSAETLANNIFNGEQQSLRQMITRLRKKISERLGADMGVPLDVDDFIENKPNQGYRINRNARELASPADLTPPEKIAVTG